MANTAATALTTNAATSNLTASAAGAAFDARCPSSRCSTGPSKFAQIANEIAIRNADAKARVRAISSVIAHLAGVEGAARVDRGRQRIGQVARLGLG